MIDRTAIGCGSDYVGWRGAEPGQWRCAHVMTAPPPGTRPPPWSSSPSYICIC